MALTATEEALVRQLLDQQAAILSLAGNEATITSKLGATKVTLSDLVAATGMNLTDIFLVRQGTNDKSLTYQKLMEELLGDFDLSPYAKLAVPQTFTKAQRGDVVALPATAGNVAFDWAIANNFSGQVTGNVTFVNGFTNAAEGQSGVIKVLQGASVLYNWAFGTNWKYVGGSTAIPAQTQTLGAKDEIVYYIEDDLTVSFAVRSNVS